MLSKPITPGRVLYAVHPVIGTEIGAGTPVTVLGVARDEPALCLVRTPGGARVEVFASSLASVPPSGVSS